MKIHKKQKSKLLITSLLLSGLLVLCAISYGVYAKISNSWPFLEDKPHPVQNGQKESDNNINYSPPTEQEVKNSQDGKKNSQDPPSNEGGSAASQKSAHIALSYVDFSNKRLEIRAFTTSVIEGNGKCTATVTSGQKSITRTSSAFIDATSTICEPIYIDQSDLTSGTWKVTVTYASKEYSGSSETVEVNY